MVTGTWNRERQLLRRLMEAGGYFTKRQFVNLSEALGIGSSAPAVRERLVRWERLGWVRPFDSGVGWGTEIYKLGFRALCLLGNRDSHIRRSHSWNVIMRKLRTVDFITERLKEGFNLAFQDHKKWDLVKRAGFTIEILPRRAKGRTFVRTSSEVLGMKDNGTLHVFHLDKEGISAKKNLEAMLKDFSLAIASGGRGLKFTIIVFESRREWDYLELLKIRKHELEEADVAMEIRGQYPELFIPITETEGVKEEGPFERDSEPTDLSVWPSPNVRFEKAKRKPK